MYAIYCGFYFVWKYRYWTKTVLKQKGVEVLCFLTSSSELKRNEDFRLQEITVVLDGTT